MTIDKELPCFCPIPLRKGNMCEYCFGKLPEEILVERKKQKKKDIQKQ